MPDGNDPGDSRVPDHRRRAFSTSRRRRPLRDQPDSSGEVPLRRSQRTAKQVRTLLRRVDRDPLLLAAAERLRHWLPGDAQYGDPLSLSRNTAGGLLGRRLASVAAQQPSVLRELGLGALQVWQAHAVSYPREVGDEDMAVLFTDLAGFSAFTLEAGDDTAVEMLRQVGAAIEPLINRRGTVVKRLGDGVMAVFGDANEAVAAAIGARDAVDDVVVAGYQLRLRAGVHVGRPRKLADDYFGLDINIAARVAAAAGPGEVLISSPTAGIVDTERLVLRRRMRFKAKGVPDGVGVLAVEPK